MNEWMNEKYIILSRTTFMNENSGQQYERMQVINVIIINVKRNMHIIMLFFLTLNQM